MRPTLNVRRRVLRTIAALAIVAPATANATPAVVMDATTGDVLYQQDATQPWYPASTTKLMSVYVALSAVRDHKIAMDTPLVVSARAHHMPPSKMGFPIGTQVTLDNALKMLMVKSANDIAITVAEGVSGSVEAFADDMNQAAADLGLRESHFVNPNGLPNPEHVSSARDMALIARALYTQFPDQAGLFSIGSLQLGREMINNHNNLLGRYPGVDGMKTGFTCPAGFNVVASAYRDGRRLVTVVMGAPSVAARTAKVAALFDRAFAGIDRPSASILALAPSTVGEPPDMRDQVCRNRGALIAQFNAEVEQLDAALNPPSTGLGLGLAALNPERAFLFNTQNVTAPTTPTALTINSMPPPAFNPVSVHIGAEDGYSGIVAQARAPHSPVGSEPVPLTAAAYAAAPSEQPVRNIGGTPLAVDANALPMHGRKAKTAQAKRSRAHTTAAAQAPKTKVLADTEPDEQNAERVAPKLGKKPPAARKREAGAGDAAAKVNKVKKPVAVNKTAAKPASSSKKASSATPAKVKSAAQE